MTIYALLVGINAYDGCPLRGAVADVVAAREFLDTRAPGCRIEQLINERATRRGDRLLSRAPRPRPAR